MYHCAQNKHRQHKVKKNQADGVKHRDKDQMDTFDCDGWLHINIWEDSDIVFVKLKHEEDHVYYWNIDVPNDVQDFVKRNSEMSPTQV